MQKGRPRAVLRKGTRVYVPYEADKTGGTVSGTFLDLAGNQLLKRGGYLLMGHMTGPDSLFRLIWSVLTETGIDGRSERQTIGVPRCWLADLPGQRKTRRFQGDLFDIIVIIPIGSEGRASRFLAMRTKHIHKSI